MRTKLAVIAVSGFAVSVACLSGAFALGGNAVGDAVFNFGGIDLPRCGTMGNTTATATSRTLAWDSDDDRAAVAVPANTHYRAGSGDEMVIKGDPALLAHVRVRNGVVEMDCRGNFGRSSRFDVTLPGRRNFRSFALLGTGDMNLSGLSQKEVAVSLAGSGNIEVEGKTDKLDVDLKGTGNIEAKGQANELNVDVKGSGNLKMADLAVKNADVDIKGSGKVELAPQDSLNVDIKGSGSIYLHSEPRKIETSIRGSGTIVHPDGTMQGGRSHERHARADDDAIGAAIQEALANDSDADRDELDHAKSTLKARIRAQIARELARQDNL
jgi:Putative auto-transporter adhesin, head GIN domain